MEHLPVASVGSSGGDSPYTQTETWNGTNWSTANQMINDEFWIGGTGTSNAGITVGGVVVHLHNPLKLNFGMELIGQPKLHN